MHTPPASQSRREYSTCGQRATGTGLGLPPVIEHVGGLLKRPHPLEHMVPASGEVGAQLLVWDQLLRFNEGRDPERLDMKYEAMRQSPFAVSAARAVSFWEDWPLTPRSILHP